MFEFKFSQDDQNVLPTADPPSTAATIEWLDSQEIVIEDLDDKTIDTDTPALSTVRTIKCGSYEINYFPASDVIGKLPSITRDSDEISNKVLTAEQNHSDLVTAIYEGGLKIWECTYDLLNFIQISRLDFDEKTVLDLGCGAGLVGILCGLSNASNCYFQDYNIEVLRHITIPNVRLNRRSKDHLGKSRFFSGDWNSFTNLIESISKFDYIFTSETIYNAENYDKLHALFQRLLKQNAKYHYFGVGGGIPKFQELLRKRNVFQYECCWQCPNGVKREILKITFK